MTAVSVASLEIVAKVVVNLDSDRKKVETEIDQTVAVIVAVETAVTAVSVESLGIVAKVVVNLDSDRKKSAEAAAAVASLEIAARAVPAEVAVRTAVNLVGFGQKKPAVAPPETG